MKLLTVLSSNNCKFVINYYINIMAWYNPKTWFNQYQNPFNHSIYGQKDVPLWVDVNVEKYESIYREIPHVRIVIDKLASMFSNANIVITDLNGEKLENQDTNEFYKLLEKPNPLQSREEFLMQMFIYNALYGTTFNNKLAVNGNVYGMYNLPSQHMQTVLSGKIFKQISIEDIVSYYKLDLGDGTSERYETNDILLTTTPSPDNPILGTSKIESLKMPISNIKAVLSKSNMILNKMGAIGILSNEGAKDGMGAIPMKPKEKKDIHEQYQSNYGHEANKMGIVISEANLKWQSMSFPTKDLMLYEELESDFAQIIDIFGGERDLFSSSKGATFENMSHAEKSTYNNTIIPFANNYGNALSEFLGAKEKGFNITLDYSHLSIMQENELERSQVLMNNAKAIETLRNNGLEDVANRLADEI